MWQGIERFLSTDINNPAAGAQAQSQIVVMWDRLSKDVFDFNHVPGGSNIVYMDGHATFERFPSEEGPVNLNFATFDAMVNPGS